MFYFLWFFYPKREEDFTISVGIRSYQKVNVYLQTSTLEQITFLLSSKEVTSSFVTPDKHQEQQDNLSLRTSNFKGDVKLWLPSLENDTSWTHCLRVSPTTLQHQTEIWHYHPLRREFTLCLTLLLPSSWTTADPLVTTCALLFDLRPSRQQYPLHLRAPAPTTTWEVKMETTAEGVYLKELNLPEWTESSWTRLVTNTGKEGKETTSLSRSLGEFISAKILPKLLSIFERLYSSFDVYFYLTQN